MGCHEQNAASPAHSLEVVLQAVVNDELRDIGFIQLGEVRELDQEPPKILKRAAQNPFALVFAHLREGHSEIVKAGEPLPPGEMKTKPGKGSRSTICGWTGQDAERLDQRQSKAVLGEFFYASAHAGILA